MDVHYRVWHRSVGDLLGGLAPARLEKGISCLLLVAELGVVKEQKDTAM